VETWLETHGDFARAADTKEILQAAGAENTGAIWDPLNSFSEFGEDPAAGLAVWLPGLRHAHIPGLRHAHIPGLRHAHIKDARQAGSLWEPVLMGTGDFPAARVVDLLRQHDYRGFVSFEWEKRWHAQIPEPEVALPHFMQWMRAALED
jgi:sugar phosphate isomerase/epimerase